MIFNWDPEKNELLKKQRGISFEAVEKQVSDERVLAVIDHPNQKRYSGQQFFVINLNQYVYMVPFVWDKEKNEIFLKTIIPSRKLKKNFYKNYMSHDYQLDNDEQELLDAFENGTTASVSNEEEMKEILQQTAINAISQRKAISIRFLEKDIRNAKVRAIQEGMPYQTFISSVLHRYLNGQLVPV